MKSKNRLIVTTLTIVYTKVKVILIGLGYNAKPEYMCLTVLCIQASVILHLYLFIYLIIKAKGHECHLGIHHSKIHTI